MKIYVGNLPYQLSEEELLAVFQKFGETTSAKIVKDWGSGQSKGFGFVEMPVQVEAEKAIKELNGSELEGKTIRVNIAREKNAKFRRPRRF